MSIKSRDDLLNKQAEVNEQIKSYTCRVLVCSGTGCIASGAQKIYDEMATLCERIDGVTVEMQKDVPHVGVVKTGCQGLCELGSLMRIEPYDYQYVHVQPEDCKEIVEKTILEGKPVGEVVTKAIENGLLVISAGSNVLRLVPPLVITEVDIDEMIEKLEKSF